MCIEIQDKFARKDNQEEIVTFSQEDSNLEHKPTLYEQINNIRANSSMSYRDGLSVRFQKRIERLEETKLHTSLDCLQLKLLAVLK